MENKAVITKIIKELGILANVKGYHYICYGVELLIEDIMLSACTMNVYRVIAEKFNTTPQRVERAIRHAIEMGWYRANVDTVKKIFGIIQKPTSGEFMATIADYIIVNQSHSSGEEGAI